MKNYTIKDRIEFLIGNMEHQGIAHWDDIEKVEHILAHLIMGKRLDDEFTFIDNHLEVLIEYFNHTYTTKK